MYTSTRLLDMKLKQPQKQSNTVQRYWFFEIFLNALVVVVQCGRKPTLKSELCTYNNKM